jgi:predicted acyl esterase
MYLDLSRNLLVDDKPDDAAQASYMGMGPGIELSTAPMQETVELTGPMSAVLYVSSASTDMDLFLTVRAYDPHGREVLFRGATDPAVPIAQGWLRASHRATDPSRSLPGRPFHPHRFAEPMVPGEIYRVEVEIWPTSIVLPAGYRLALRIDGRDFEREGETSPRKGSGPFLHTDPRDRDPTIFAVENTLHSGGACDAHLLLPVVPRTT